LRKGLVWIWTGEVIKKGSFYDWKSKKSQKAKAWLRKCKEEKDESNKEEEEEEEVGEGEG